MSMFLQQLKKVKQVNNKNWLTQQNAFVCGNNEAQEGKSNK